MLKYIIGLGLLTSCGQIERPTKPEPETRIYDISQVQIDSELKGFVKEFIGELELAGVNYNIDIQKIELVEEIEENIIGRCYYKNKIQFLKRKVSYIRNKAVMFHELGHCILKLGHTPEDSNTIMQPIELDDDQYLIDNWESLVVQLLNQKASLNLVDVEKDH